MARKALTIVPPAPEPPSSIIPKTGPPARADSDVRALAKAHTADAIAALAEIMADSTVAASSRVSAAIALLDRAHGKAQQTVETRSTDMTALHLEAIKAVSEAAKGLKDISPGTIDGSFNVVSD